jgi:hypothetical protein
MFLHPPVIFSSLGPHIILSTLFSNTNLRSSLVETLLLLRNSHKIRQLELISHLRRNQCSSKEFLVEIMTRKQSKFMSRDQSGGLDIT